MGSSCGPDTLRARPAAPERAPIAFLLVVEPQYAPSGQRGTAQTRGCRCAPRRAAAPPHAPTHGGAGPSPRAPPRQQRISQPAQGRRARAPGGAPWRVDLRPAEPRPPSPRHPLAGRHLRPLRRPAVQPQRHPRRHPRTLLRPVPRPVVPAPRLRRGRGVWPRRRRLLRQHLVRMTKRALLARTCSPAPRDVPGSRPAGPRSGGAPLPAWAPG